MKGFRENYEDYDYYEENRATDWYSDRTADKLESTRADMNMITDIFDCGLDSRIEHYANSMAGICF